MGFVELFTSANTLTGNMYGITLPFLLLAIIYGALSAFGFNKAFSSATFGAFVAGLPLYAMGVIPDYVMVILIMLVLIGTFFLFRSEGK